jgi:hypothetical protein
MFTKLSIFLTQARALGQTSRDSHFLLELIHPVRK